jgi:hypothetical protein
MLITKDVSNLLGLVGIVPKRTGEHAQIEKRIINLRTFGCIRVLKLKGRRKSTFWRTTEAQNKDQ